MPPFSCNSITAPIYPEVCIIAESVKLIPSSTYTANKQTINNIRAILPNDIKTRSSPTLDKYAKNRIKKEISLLEMQLKLHPGRSDIRLNILELRKTLNAKHIKDC